MHNPASLTPCELSYVGSIATEWFNHSLNRPTTDDTGRISTSPDVTGDLSSVDVASIDLDRAVASGKSEDDFE